MFHILLIFPANLFLGFGKSCEYTFCVLKVSIKYIKIAIVPIHLPNCERNGLGRIKVGTLGIRTEVEKVVNPVILDDRKYFQNYNLAENIFKP